MNKKEHKLIQSYVRERYFVSTAFRKSSALTEAPIWYYETIVFTWNRKTRETEEIILQEDSGYSSIVAIESHFKICKHLEKQLNENK